MNQFTGEGGTASTGAGAGAGTAFTAAGVVGGVGGRGAGIGAGGGGYGAIPGRDQTLSAGSLQTPFPNLGQRGRRVALSGGAASGRGHLGARADHLSSENVGGTSGGGGTTLGGDRASQYTSL